MTLGLTLASLVASAVLTGGSAYVSAFTTSDRIVQYYLQYGGAARLSALLLFGSSVPLGILAAVSYTRLLRLGVRVPGPSIGFFGGIAGSLMLMMSALAGWMVTRPELAGDVAVMRSLLLLAFLTGGVGYVVNLGLLVAGIAVPALMLGLLPRWLSWAGLAIAAVSELAFLSLEIEPLQVLLPVGRFCGLVWLVAAGFLLSGRRPTRTEGIR